MKARIVLIYRFGPILYKGGMLVTEFLPTVTILLTSKLEVDNPFVS